MPVSYLDVGGIKSLEPYMAAFAQALGQRLSPSGREATSYYKDPKKWVDTAKQGWKKKTPPSVRKEYGDIIFNPQDPEQFYYETDVTIPDWAKTLALPSPAQFDPAMRGGANFPVPPPFDPRMPAQLDAGTSGNSILDLMNIERTMTDGQHYPAILHKGEEVINPMASEVFRPVLQQMNQAVPSGSQAMPPIMDVGGRIEEARLLQHRGSPWAPMGGPPVPPQTTAGRPPIVPMPTDPAQLRLLQGAGLTVPAQPVPTTSGGQAEEARRTGYAPLGRERYTQPEKLDPKKKKELDKAVDIIAKVMEDVQKEEAEKAKKGKGEGAPLGLPPPPSGPPPAAFRPSWRRSGQPMNIDWEYIQSLPPMQAQMILQQYVDTQQTARVSPQQSRAGVGPMDQRMQLMQGLMGQYRGGAEMPGVKGEAAYSAEKGTRAGDIISADINYKKALAFSERLKLAVADTADPQEAGKLRQLAIKNHQEYLKAAATRAKIMKGQAYRDYQKVFAELQVLMNPNITVADIVRGMPKPSMSLFRGESGEKEAKERQKNTLTEQEVTEIIAEMALMFGGGGSVEGQAKSMGYAE